MEYSLLCLVSQNKIGYIVVTKHQNPSAINWVKISCSHDRSTCGSCVSVSSLLYSEMRANGTPSILGHCQLYCRGEREHGKSGLLELSSEVAQIGPTHFLAQSKPVERQNGQGNLILP